MIETDRIPAFELRSAAARLAKRTIWEDVTVSVERGEFVALLGPNGVGKTILLKVILGLLPVAAGEVRVLGQSPDDARSRVGYLPQGRAFDPSMRIRGVDLVRLGLDGNRWGVPLPSFLLFGSRRREEQKRIHEAIESVRASEYSGRPVGSLSGGEQQRLLIAQAIVHRPDLLLLDEPLASLDYPSQMAITALVGSISRERGMAVVMVTHDVNPIIGQAHKLIYIASEGVASGTPAEVINAPTLSRIYGSRVEVHRTADGRLLVVGEPEGAVGQSQTEDSPDPRHQPERECCELTDNEPAD